MNSGHTLAVTIGVVTRGGANGAVAPTRVQTEVIAKNVGKFFGCGNSAYVTVLSVRIF